MTTKIIGRDFPFAKHTFAITKIIPQVCQLDLCRCISAWTYKLIFKQKVCLFSLFHNN